MKVDSTAVFSMLTRLADIVQEEGVTAKLPALIGDRFSALDVDIVLPKDGDAPAEKSAAADMRNAVAEHWAIAADDHDATAPAGPRQGGPVAEAYTPNGEDDPEAIANANRSNANEIRNLAAGLLDMEQAKTPSARLTGMSFVRQALDVLAKSGMTMLEDRYATVATKLQDEAAQEASNALHALKNDTAEVGRSAAFHGTGDDLTFPELIGFIRADLEGENKLDINPSDMATDARRIAHRIDTLIGTVENDGLLNPAIVKELATDLQGLANVTTSRPQGHTPSMLMDQLPPRVSTAIRKAIAQTKLLYHFEQAYTKVPLPKPEV